MKTRSGFVSNSSSSSFILVGWDNHHDLEWEEADELGMDYYGEEGLLGVTLPEAPDYDYISVDLEKLGSAIQKAKELKEKLRYTEEPKLFYGIRAS